ncbi:MAG: hypothetical protein EOP10_11175 [Proteobacteria bacterium]|nr:MAG: hypothetical protein EOP10_11175 [Pseudomonadota bacterium]
MRPQSGRNSKWSLSCFAPHAPGLVTASDAFRVSLCVAACNRNGLDLQSSHFSTGINCVYPSQQTEIICE